MPTGHRQAELYLLHIITLCGKNAEIFNVKASYQQSVLVVILLLFRIVGACGEQHMHSEHVAHLIVNGLYPM
jgi:hypothetical protein